MFELLIANKNYSSWSLRPWLLMRELGIAFREEQHPFGDAAAFRAFSPSSKVPCLRDGELLIWDSLAITEYLAEQEPRVWPADARSRAWARSAAAEMHAGFGSLRTLNTMNCGLRVAIAEPWPPALLRDWQRLDALWCEGLARFGGPFVAGAAFSAADAFFAPVALRAQTYGPKLSAPAQAYLQRLLDLPSLQDWYRAALAETWRDAEHEEEARSAGTWLQDLRVPVANPAEPVARPTPEQGRTLGRMVLLVRDYEEALAFYRDRLGFKTLFDRQVGERRFLHLHLPGQTDMGLWLLRAETPEQLQRVGRQTAGQPCAVLYCRDLAAEYRRLREEQGIEFLREPAQADGAAFAHFLDPYGNEFVLVQLGAGA